MSKTTNKFPPEVRDRAVRLVLDSSADRASGSSRPPNGQHGSRWQAVMSISAKISCAPRTLDDRVKKAQVDSGHRAGIPSDLAEKMKALERENRELRQAKAVLRKASANFAMAELGRRSKRWSGSSTVIEERTGSIASVTAGAVARNEALRTSKYLGRAPCGDGGADTTAEAASRPRCIA